MKVHSGIMLVLGSLIAVSGLLFAANDTKNDAAEEELKKLQGTCKFVSAERRGTARSEEEIKDAKFIIKGNTMVFEKDGKPVEGKAAITIDPTTKPKMIDITVFYPNDPQGGKTTLGIYTLEGDTLTIAGGKQRPAEYKTTPETGDTEVIVLKREKP